MLLDEVKMTKKCLGKSPMTSGKMYRIYLSYKGKKCSFVYHDNYLNEVKKTDVIYCFCMDARAYLDSKNFEDFCNNFGYDTDSIKALKTYKACKKQAEKCTRLFPVNMETILLQETE